jgi:hypothetical protein
MNEFDQIMERYLAMRIAGPKLTKAQRRRANDADRALREQKARAAADAEGHVRAMLAGAE